MIVVFLTVVVIRVLLSGRAAALLVVPYHLGRTNLDSRSLRNSCANLMYCLVQLNEFCLKKASRPSKQWHIF